MLTQLPPQSFTIGKYTAVVTEAQLATYDYYEEPVYYYQFVIVGAQREDRKKEPLFPGTLADFTVYQSVADQAGMIRMRIGDKVRVRTYAPTDGSEQNFSQFSRIYKL